MTIAKLYQKHVAGEISKAAFLYEVRRDSNVPYVTNLTSYEDAIKILKNKSIINEADAEGYTQLLTQRGMGTPEYPGTAYKMKGVQKPKDPVFSDILNNIENGYSYEESIELAAAENGMDEDELFDKYPRDVVDTEGHEPLQEGVQLTVTQIIDRLNPYHFKHAMEFEVAKIKGEVSQDQHNKIREKVAKKMQKDPLAYESANLANAKDIEKRDAKLEMEPVKGGNLKDKDNEMKKVKGAEIKKNTGTSKKENRKGKPKGVKEMKGSKKKPTGVSKVMDSQGKETIVEALVRFFREGSSLNEDSVIPSDRTDYGKGHQIETAEGKGTVIEKRGSIVVVEMEDGSEKTFTLNVLDKHNAMNRFDDEPKPEERAKDAEKAERDAMWKDFDKQQNTGENPYNKTFGGELAYEPEDIRSLLKKLKEITEKLKMKKEAKKFKAGGETIFKSDTEAPGYEADLKKAKVQYTKSNV